MLVFYFSNRNEVLYRVSSKEQMERVRFGHCCSNYQHQHLSWVCRRSVDEIAALSNGMREDLLFVNHFSETHSIKQIYAITVTNGKQTNFRFCWRVLLIHLLMLILITHYCAITACACASDDISIYLFIFLFIFHVPRHATTEMFGVCLLSPSMINPP